jgi:hypothetical protein
MSVKFIVFVKVYGLKLKFMVEVYLNIMGNVTYKSDGSQCCLLGRQVCYKHSEETQALKARERDSCRNESLMQNFIESFHGD